jgi:hypothetical protein
MRACLAAIGVAWCAGPALAQLAFVTNVAGAYEDISATGTPLNLGLNGTATINTPFTNAVFTSTIVTVGNNLTIGFGAAAAAGGAPPANTPLPSPTLFNGQQALCIMWDSPGQNLPVSNVYYQAFADHYTIQWDNLPKGGAGSTIVAQVQVFDGGALRANKFAQMFYPDVEQPGVRDLGTIGYQNGPTPVHPFNDITYAFNNLQSVVNNETILTLVPAPGTLAAIGLLALARRRR